MMSVENINIKIFRLFMFQDVDFSENNNTFLELGRRRSEEDNKWHLEVVSSGFCMCSACVCITFVCMSMYASAFVRTRHVR